MFFIIINYYFYLCQQFIFKINVRKYVMNYNICEFDLKIHYYNISDN